MRSVNFSSIESFSSEDPNHPAANLLKPANKKWRCREVGESSAFVILRLEEPIQISGIDIGNEHSAFIEVLVARSGPINPSFTEILLSTKFMNPVESRNSTSSNRVQFFNTAALVPTAVNAKWDLVKVICTQPFNSRVRYGLSFLALHTASSEKKDKSLVPEKFQKQIRDEASKANPSNVVSFGRFKLREESPDSDGNDAAGGGSLNVFARWKEKLKPNSLQAGTSVSALMRDAVGSKATQKTIPTPGSVRNVAVTHRPKPQLYESSDDEPSSSRRGREKVKANRNNESILYDEEDEKPDKKLNDSIARHQLKEKQESRKDAPKVDASTNKSGSRHDTSSSKFKEFLNSTGQTIESESKQKDEVKNKPRTSMEKDHDFPRSTPDGKSEMSVKMATTKVRTPLPIEKEPLPKKRLSSPVSLGGRIESCSPASKKPKTQVHSDEEVTKRVQYKPFGRLLENVVLVISGIQNPERGNIRSQALAMGAKYKPDWDTACTHLICAYKNTPKYNQVHGKGKIIKKEWIETCYKTRKRISWRKFAVDTEEANVSDSEDEIVDIADKPPEPTVSDDQDVELIKEGEPVMLYELEESDSDVGAVRNDKPYDISTEEEGERCDENATENMDIFKGKKFYLDPALGAVDIIKLEKFIQSFKGTVSKAMEHVDYVISRNKQKLPAFCRAELVKPLWIYECNEMECLIPIKRYLIQ